MTIRELAYELYKIDWMSRISLKTQADTIKKYYMEVDEEDRIEYSFEDYLFEFGYLGSLYACEDEFFDVEYLDEEYIKTLFDNKEMFTEYQKDLKELNKNV